MWRRSERTALLFCLLALGAGSAQWLDEEEEPGEAREQRQLPNYGGYGGYGGFGGYGGYGGYGGHGGYGGYGGANNIPRGFAGGNRINALSSQRGGPPKASGAIRQPAARPAPRPAARPAPPAASKSGGGANKGGGGKCGVTIEISYIVNGERAKRGEFPWQAGLVYQLGGTKSVRCGGALVHPQFVLTAAHCIDPQITKGWRLVEVRLGLVDQRSVDENARSFVPDRRTPHPQYLNQDPANNRRNLNDIALLHLPQAAPYTDYIRPICLPKVQGRAAAIAAAPSVMTVAGWGEMGNDSASDFLLFAPVDPVSAAECGRQLGVSIPDTQMCAGGAKDSCKGDSGGPLIRAGVNEQREGVFELMGVVAFGYTPCGTAGKPGVYTRVAPYLGWIKQVMGQQ